MPITTYLSERPPHTSDDKDIQEALDILRKSGIQDTYVQEYVLVKRRWAPWLDPKLTVSYGILVDIGHPEYQIINLYHCDDIACKTVASKEVVLAYLYGLVNGADKMDKIWLDEMDNGDAETVEEHKNSHLMENFNSDESI